MQRATHVNLMSEMGGRGLWWPGDALPQPRAEYLSSSWLLLRGTSLHFPTHLCLPCSPGKAPATCATCTQAAEPFAGERNTPLGQLILLLNPRLCMPGAFSQFPQDPLPHTSPPPRQLSLPLSSSLHSSPVGDLAPSIIKTRSKPCKAGLWVSLSSGFQSGGLANGRGRHEIMNSGRSWQWWDSFTEGPSSCQQCLLRQPLSPRSDSPPLSSEEIQG